jgi:hypothetical protein
MRAQRQASPASPLTARRPWHAAAIPPRPGDGRHDVRRPLPDPVAIRLCPVPAAAPPYDDEVAGDEGRLDDRHGERGRPGGGRRGDDRHGRADAFAAAIVAALDERGGRPGRAAGKRAADGERAAAAERVADGERAAAAERVADGERAAGDGAPRPAAPARRPLAARPGPGQWPSTFAQVLAETLAGSRPPAQIAPWTTERARSHIRKLGPLLRASQRPLVQRVITSRPASGVVEMSVVVGFGPRVRALAVRMERTDPRPATPGHAGKATQWLCTAVEAA